MYSKSVICSAAAMAFESCASDDSRSANILTSPELTLSSSKELVVTMMSVPSLEHTTVDLYKTSSLGIIGTRLGSLSVVYPVTGPDFTLRYATIRICLPAGTYQLAFVASDVVSATPSAAIAEVSLSNSACTVASSAGMTKNTVIDLSFYGISIGASFSDSLQKRTKTKKDNWINFDIINNKNQTSPFTSATPISCNGGITLL